ncbi:Crp/Fnr family transcriptional regulator [uncultured Paludibaculum sp.]|uniref:Crp/Fnr family transcriptional regulator n=1 Tax=uncultured Paludibaculum sp. TaxID=1765020 RepID=UPI002AAC4CFB|nr:Crp/Fnr family transcriptional regulator [uncultured Paludibaculum sp.]
MKPSVNAGLQFVQAMDGERLASWKHPSTLYRAGEAADSIYFVESGAARLFQPRRGSLEYVLTLVHPGDVLGEEAIFGKRKRETSAALMDPSLVWRIKRSSLLKAKAESPNVAHWLAERFALQRRSLLHRMNQHALMGVEQRLVAALLELATVFPATGGDKEALIGISQIQIAGLAGSTRETVSTQLNRLEKLGLVRLGKNRVSIANLEPLRKLLDNHNGA